MVLYLPLGPTTKKGAAQVKFSDITFQYQRRNAWYLPWHPVRALHYPLHTGIIDVGILLLYHMTVRYASIMGIISPKNSTVRIPPERPQNRLYATLRPDMGIVPSRKTKKRLFTTHRIPMWWGEEKCPAAIIKEDPHGLQPLPRVCTVFWYL